MKPATQLPAPRRIPDSFVTKGSKWHVQVRVFDFTDSPVKSWNEEPVRFAVSRRPASAKRGCTFGSGAMYYGPSLSTGLLIAQRYCGILPVPPASWNKYFDEPSSREAHLRELAKRKGSAA